MLQDRNFTFKGTKIRSLKRFLSIIWRKFLFGFIRGKNCQILGNIKISRNSAVGDYTTITTSVNGRIVISRNVSIGKFSWIAAGDGNIFIGENLLSGPRITIVAQNHCVMPYEGQPPWERDGMPSEVYIGRDVHIGANAVILPGSYIGDGSIVAANAIVSKKYEPGSLITSKDNLVHRNIGQSYKKNNSSKELRFPLIHLSNKFN